MGKQRRKFAMPVASIALAACVLGGAMVTPALADEPTEMMKNIMSATVGEVTIYRVKPGMDQQFMDAMVQAGPYHRLRQGIANEKVLAPLPGTEGETYFISIARYYDDLTPKRVADGRDKQVAEFLSAPPTKTVGKLVQHVFADWGWERKRSPKMLDIAPYGSDAIFSEKLTTLSYLKSGYTGQAGLVEFFDRSATPAALRSKLLTREGLTGASIYAIQGGGYMVYSEYFSSPNESKFLKISAVGGKRGPVGGQGGMVELNYVPR